MYKHIACIMLVLYEQFSSSAVTAHSASQLFTQNFINVL